MKIILNKKKLRKMIHNEKKLGFVPTMGAIHLGHISLIKKSNKQCKKTIVSIYVNKSQFNKKSDYQKYPRVLKKDISLLRKTKVDYLFLPKTKDIYPSGVNKNIKINSLKKKLCGKFRPGHFEAVVDVIDRFLKIIKPKKIFLGEKDMQQLKILDDFIRKNHANVNVVSCNTIRERNGIALSSRNSLLTKKQRIIASNVYSFLNTNKLMVIKKKITIASLNKKVLKLGIKKIDYLKIIDINKLTKPFIKRNKFKIFIAYYLGNIRLIDNF